METHRNLWFLEFPNLMGMPDTEIFREFTDLIHTRYKTDEKTQLALIKKFNSLVRPVQDHFIVPHWVMDFFKQAVEQYVIGHYFSSIIMCGEMLEFLTKRLYEIATGKEITKKISLSQCEKAVFETGKITELVNNKPVSKKFEQLRQLRNKTVHLKYIIYRNVDDDVLQYDNTIKDHNFQAFTLLLDIFHTIYDLKIFEKAY